MTPNPIPPFDTDSAWGRYRPQGLAAWILRLCHRLPANRRIAYPLIKALRGPLSHFGKRPYDVQIGNLRLRLLNRGNYCETTLLFAPQFYDRTEIGWLLRELEGGGTFLDIGANVGLYSLQIAGALGNRVGVHAVEPAPDLNRRMRFNAAENSLTVNLHTVALSDYEGDGALRLSAAQSGENALRPTGGGIESIPVKVTTLCALCRQAGLAEIRAMKIDVEGHETKILSDFFRNAPSSLWPRVIVMEHVHGSADALNPLVRERGYRLVDRTTRNVLLRRDPA